MNEITPGTTPSSNDTINVLTALNSNEGTISLTINIQKDTAKRLIYAAIAIVLICLGLAAWTIYFLGKNAEALRKAAQEDRLAAQAADDKRLENRAAWRQLGVDGIALENHDISDILEKVRQKYPPKESKQ